MVFQDAKLSQNLIPHNFGFYKKYQKMLSLKNIVILNPETTLVIFPKVLNGCNFENIDFMKFFVEIKIIEN